MQICDEKNISEDQHPGVTGHSFIDMLDDHTMLYTFKFLSMRELFTCERGELQFNTEWRTKWHIWKVFKK